MLNVRIVEIPKMRVVSSGPMRTPQEFGAFCAWWTDYDRGVGCNLCPRDFMFYDERAQARQWLYALPEGAGDGDFGGYEVITYPFGLYAVASNVDADCDGGRDWLATQAALREYALGSADIMPTSPDDDGRWPLFHIITPAGYFERTGVHQQDMYMPIAYRR